MDELTRNCLLKIWDAWKWPVDGRKGPGGKIGDRMRGDGVSSALFAQQLQTGQAGWVQRLGLTQGRFALLRVHARGLCVIPHAGQGCCDLSCAGEATNRTVSNWRMLECALAQGTRKNRANPRIAKRRRQSARPDFCL